MTPRWWSGGVLLYCVVPAALLQWWAVSRVRATSPAHDPRPLWLSARTSCYCMHRAGHQPPLSVTVPVRALLCRGYGRRRALALPGRCAHSLYCCGATQAALAPTHFLSRWIRLLLPPARLSSPLPPPFHDHAVVNDLLEYLASCPGVFTLVFRLPAVSICLYSGHLPQRMCALALSSPRAFYGPAPTARLELVDFAFHPCLLLTLWPFFIVFVALHVLLPTCLSDIPRRLLQCSPHTTAVAVA